MVSELFSGCLFCGNGGGGGGKYDFAPSGVGASGGGDADGDDPVTARSAREHSQKIDRELRRDQRRMQKQVKLLLLGAGESGKSTFLKQMKIIHGVEFDQQQLEEFRQVIYSNMVRGMQVLVDANAKLGIGMDDDNNATLGQQLLAQGAGVARGLHRGNFGTLAPALRSLWADPGVRRAYERRREFQVADSIQYFFENIDRVASTDYVPSQQDILYCRKKTTAIHEFHLQIEDVPFLFVDVGGQRTERAKWFQCFDTVTSILFLAASSEFDQVLVEDPTMNRLQESRTIFDTIVNHRAFASISFILFLNKMDLLQDKVEQGVSVEEYFPEEWSRGDEVRRTIDKFGGDPHSLTDVKAFILYLFMSKKRSNSEPLYHHFTTAVDTRNIEYVFSSVKETILRRNLDRLMLQ